MFVDPEYKGRVLPYLRATLLAGLRSPGAWLLLALGCAGVALGLGLAVLAFDTDRSSEAPLVLECCAGAAAGLALWILASALATDRREGFSLAADQTRSGGTGRLVGRWGGATAAGCLGGLAVAVTVWALGRGEHVGVLLLFTTIGAAMLVGAWAVLLAVLGLGPAPSVLLAVGLWILGHLPWGGPGWEWAGLGPVLGAVLPDGGADPPLASAVAALSLLAFALCLRSEGAREGGAG